MSGMSDLAVLYEDPTLRVAGHEHLFLAVWTDAPTGEQMRELGRQSRAFQAERGPQTAMWDAIIGGKPAFSSEVREAAAELTADHELFPIGTAHVITLEGLRGSATRAFLTTATLLGRPKHPTRVFGDAATAAEWLSEALGWERNRLLALHDRLCERRHWS